jgi:enoyl-CoA hydratase/carnithine racemase
LVGRSRALEIVLSGDDFDADIAERYGWVNRTLDDDDLDSFVDTLVRRLASFDRGNQHVLHIAPRDIGVADLQPVDRLVDLAGEVDAVFGGE